MKAQLMARLLKSISRNTVMRISDEYFNHTEHLKT